MAAGISAVNTCNLANPTPATVSELDNTSMGLGALIFVMDLSCAIESLAKNTQKKQVKLPGSYNSWQCVQAHHDRHLGLNDNLDTFR